MIQKKKILLIDDSNVEVVLLKHVLEECQKDVNLESFTNGIEAFNDLEKRAIDDVDSLPHLILLDLNMPHISGVDFLKLLRKTEVLKNITTLVFTSSNLEKDKSDCFEAGADSFIVKPSDVGDYKVVVNYVFEEWLKD